MATSRSDGPDEKGSRGGDTGETKQKGTGAKAEKGDQRRDEVKDRAGPTRRGANNRNRSGSDSGN